MNDKVTMPTFTVFTITYKRDIELERLYRSLVRQTVPDFKWLIVSDEESEDTGTLIDKFRCSADFDIDYYVLPHGGKTKAMEFGFSKIDTPYMIDIDDDDELTEDCVETMKEEWGRIEKEHREDIGFVNALSMDEKGSMLLKYIPISYREDSNYIEMEWTRNHPAEYLISRKTSTIHDLSFMDDSGMWLADKVMNVRESVYWNRLAKKYNTRYLYKPLRIYHRNHQGRLSNMGFNKQKCIDYVFSNYTMLKELRGRWHENIPTTLKYMLELIYCYIGSKIQ